MNEVAVLVIFGGICLVALIGLIFVIRIMYKERRKAKEIINQNEDSRQVN